MAKAKAVKLIIKGAKKVAKKVAKKAPVKTAGTKNVRAKTGLLNKKTPATAAKKVAKKTPAHKPKVGVAKSPTTAAQGKANTKAFNKRQKALDSAKTPAPTKTAAKKVAKKAPVKTAAKKAPVKKAPAKKAPAKKVAAKKVAAKKTPKKTPKKATAAQTKAAKAKKAAAAQKKADAANLKESQENFMNSKAYSKPKVKSKSGESARSAGYKAGKKAAGGKTLKKVKKGVAKVAKSRITQGIASGAVGAKLGGGGGGSEDKQSKSKYFTEAELQAARRRMQASRSR
jgi:hypothetical protein